MLKRVSSIGSHPTLNPWSLTSRRGIDEGEETRRIGRRNAHPEAGCAVIAKERGQKR